MSLLTKRNIVFVNILLVLVLILAVFIQETCDLHSQTWCNKNWSLIGRIGGLAIMLIVLLLPPSFVVLPLNSNVFEAWKKFAVWAVPSVLAIVTALSFVEPGGSIGGMVEQRMLAAAIIGLYVAYTIASVAIISVAWSKSRK